METPSLKAIFDNLRNYPILAIFYLVARDIVLLPFPIATAFHYVLMAILIFLSIATFAQSAFLFTALALGFTVGILPEQFRPKGKENQWWFAFFFANFGLFCFGLAFAVFMVIQRIRFIG